MAAEKFNALKGFSVGIPAIDVIDSNGNIVTNVVVPSGNVTANKVYANHYYYANGTPFSSDPAGTNTEVQFNNNGVLGASANFTFNTTTQTVSVSNFSASGNLVNLGNVDNLQIDGGLNGYVLQTDGAGNLSWTAQTGNGGGGNGVPGGSNTQVQFNDAGAFGGDSGFIYDKDTNLLSVDYIGGDGSNLSNITYANITGIGNISSIDLDGNAQHVLYGNGVFAEIDTGTISNYANYAGNVTISAQPNITSVGTLTSLNVTGTTQTGNLSVSGDIGADGLIVTGPSQFMGNITLNSIGTFTGSGPVNLASSPNVNLTLANLHIDGGINGYVLSTDGTGNLSWSAGGGGGNGVPGGSNTQIQFNDSGSFAGSPYMTFNKSDNKVNFAGEVTANVFTMGSGSFEFRTSEICIANTTSTSNIELCQTPVEDLAALDYVIIATDEFSGKRQYLNINAVYYNTDVVYNETSALYIGGLVTDYDLTYVPGDVFLPARIVLWVTPATTNQITYKIMVQRYRD